MNKVVSILLYFSILFSDFVSPRLAWGAVDTTGNYWYGHMGTDLYVGYNPTSETGTMVVTATTVTKDTTESDGSHNIGSMNITGQYVDADRWLNLELEQSEHLQGTANGTLIDLIDRNGNDNTLDRTLLLKKADSLPQSGIQGDWIAFEHAIDISDEDTTMGYGLVTIGSSTLSYTVDHSDGLHTEITNTAYTYNSSTATMNVLGRNYRVGNGMMVYFDIDTADDELFYDVLVKKSSGKTLADLEGKWLYQEYVTRPLTAEPMTGWGILDIDRSGNWDVNITYNRAGSIYSSPNSGTISIESDGDMLINDIGGLSSDGILSQDENTIVYSLFGQSGTIGIGIIVRVMGSPDITGDGKVNFVDFARLAAEWLDDSCVDPDWCAR